MAGVSDIIEKFLKEMLENSENGIIEIGRNDLASKFSCAPSQINYVLTTRFSSTNGYYIESHRGGSGYIKIATLSNEDSFFNSIMEYLEENSITFNEGRRIVNRIFELGYITKRERFIILHAISDNSLCIDSKGRDSLRSNVLLNILYSFRRENE
ncbi:MULTISPECIES: CtsR family transcriptional regulator [Parvimonas]|uniref:CtsR family transcriptional regulator n=1 Tax=Parvimonas parva TaxID=2769485 RepID=A0ABS1CBA0_9FIRM|nr:MULTISPECIES: CtsR family transcriptional regulator [Parvimonas]KXB67673.1 putative transcriptional regulator CtsR [Parvimonas sp. KA00067]MBK1469174.1 CtsR family transcriptional regulator [Parvimonas parva]